jgi:copper binding plastocyanin/azurin family protein
VIRRLLTGIILAVVAGCSGYNAPMDPSTGGGGSDPAPATASVIVGNVFFKSGHNGSTNLAVDTVAVGGIVTWTWTGTGDIPHSVRSLGSPIFRNSIIQTGDGKTHEATFHSAGTYQYDCAIHGPAMTGTIVVR